MKLLTVTIPCYNSAAYMARAVESVLPGGEDVEILIVDDGSTDETPAIADEYEKKYPGIIRAIHQENKGHGGAVNTGIRNASGVYFKVVDSDDWLDGESFQKALEVLRKVVEDGSSLDMFVANYVYEKVAEDKKKVIHYRTALPKDRLFTWDEVKYFQQGHYILMHAVIYRTKLLRDCGLSLPEHTFYVDNLFVYQPLPYVKTMYYLDMNLYRYFIGRDDQSVTVENMIRRIDQQARVNCAVIECCDVMSLKNKKLRNYMIKFLSIMMTVTSVYLIKEGSEESLRKKEDIWEFLKEKDKRLYKKIHNNLLGRSMNFKSRIGRWIVKVGYSISKMIFKFG